MKVYVDNERNVKINYETDENGYIKDFNANNISNNDVDNIIDFDYHFGNIDNNNNIIKSLINFLDKYDDWTEEALLKVYNKLKLSGGFPSHDCLKDIENKISMHERSIDFIKKFAKLIGRFYENYFICDYISKVGLTDELFKEYGFLLKENNFIPYLKFNKANFEKYFIPILKEKFNEMDKNILYSFLENNLGSLIYDYNEIKRLLPMLNDKEIIFLTKNMPLQIANRVISEDMEMRRNTENRFAYDYCAHAYFYNNPDKNFILDNIDEIVNLYDDSLLDTLDFIYAKLMDFKDETFIRLFKRYRSILMNKGIKLNDIFVYSRFIKISTLLDIIVIEKDSESFLENNIYECNKRIQELCSIYNHELNCIENEIAQTNYNLHNLDYKSPLLNCMENIKDNMIYDLENYKQICLDCLKFNIPYNHIDKIIKTIKFNQALDLDEKFEDKIYIFTDLNKINIFKDEQNKRISLQEFIEKIFNVEIKERKKSIIPESIINGLASCLIKGEFRLQNNLSIPLDIDINISEENLINFIKSFKISAEDKRSLENKDLIYFLK